MEMIRGADGRLYRVTGHGCTIVREIAKETKKTAFRAEEMLSVDDDGAARMFISG